jgi:hypothetical protein
MLRRIFARSMKSFSLNKRKGIQTKFALRTPINFRFSEQTEETIENNGKIQNIIPYY